MCICALYFFFHDTATTEIYTLSLHERSSDLPAAVERAPSQNRGRGPARSQWRSWSIDARQRRGRVRVEGSPSLKRSEEHTSELQSRLHLVCRLLLEKKKKNVMSYIHLGFTHA